MIRTTHAHSARTAPEIRSRAGRRGVTLVEMLVATAMCIAGMWMLTWMFQQATASFSLANAQVTLTGHERLVQLIMKRDIDADRFPEDDDPALINRGRRLSDFKDRNLQSSPPQRGGYFIARSNVARTPGTAGSVNFVEGPPGATGQYLDFYRLQSSRSTDHFIQFTTILPDTPGNRYFSEVQVIPDPPATQTPVSRTTAGIAAEISYYLVQTGQTPNGTPLFDLMRVQRIVAQGTDANDYLRDVVFPAYRTNPSTSAPADIGLTEVMACTQYGVNPVQMFTLRDLGNVGNFQNVFWTNAPRFPGASPPPPPVGAQPTARPTTSRRYGEDRLMSNVLSMEIKFTGPIGQTLAPTVGGDSSRNIPPVDAWPRGDPSMINSPFVWPRPLVEDRGAMAPNPPYPGNSDFPYDNLPYDGRFDTSDADGSKANPQSLPTANPPKFLPTRQPVSVTGVQIRIRAFSNGTTRQTTFTFAL